MLRADLTTIPDYAETNSGGVHPTRKHAVLDYTEINTNSAVGRGTCCQTHYDSRFFVQILYQTEQAFQSSNVGELVPDWFENGKLLAFSSSGLLMSLYEFHCLRMHLFLFYNISFVHSIFHCS